MAADRVWNMLRRGARDNAGSIAIQTALMLTVMVGFVALGIEASNLVLQHRSQQAATDNAAMAAAAGLGSVDPTTEARAVTAELGLRDGVGGVTVTVANPPSIGSHAADANYVEVDVQQSVTPVLASVYHPDAFVISTRAVAVKSTGVAACVMALDSSAANAFQVSNNAVVTVSQCGAVVNSSSNSALSLGNNTKIDGPANVVGGASLSNGATVTGTLTTNTAVAADPYAGYTLPTKPSQALTAPSYPSSALSPGWYPNGWSFSNGATVNLQAGTYWIGSQLAIGNNVTITGQGVTLVLDGSYAINLGNGVTFNLTAPSSGSTAGIIFYSSPTNSSTTQNFGNGAVLNTTGVLYFPSQTVRFPNNVVTGVSACTQLVAKVIQIQNNVTFNANCSGVGVATLGNKSNANLVE